MTLPAYVSVDYETRSTADLRKTGVYRYAEDPTTDVLCMAYALNNEPVQLWRMGEPVPALIYQALEDDDMYLRAWNAQFERIIWQYVLSARKGWPTIPNDKFVCAMVAGAAAGLPLSLDQAAMALGLVEQKDKEGHRLMMQMSKPRRIEEDGTIVWWDDEERLQRLYSYCKQDVKVERAIWSRLPPSMNKLERKIYLLDQEINDRGVRLDLDLIHAAEKMAGKVTKKLNSELASLTGSVARSYTRIADIKAWVQSRGVPCSVLDKAAVSNLLAVDSALPADVRRVLEIRQEGAKTSVRKLAKMQDVACADGRARGLLQFYGAGTGRWSGRLLQPQNYPRGTVEVTNEVLEAVLGGDVEEVDKFGPPMEVLSSLLRGTFIADNTTLFFDADYASIEARVVAWLAQEEKLLALFRSDGLVYEAMAARIFGIPIEDVDKDQRFLGKSATLGCGFGMGQAKFAMQYDVDPALATRAVETYRLAFPRIKDLWNRLDRAALTCVRNQSRERMRVGRLSFRMVGEWLAMGLPSGRSLWYHRPRIVERPVPWGGTRPSIEVDSLNSVTRQWEPRDMYGGIWTENATQAVARDILVEGLLRTEKKLYRTVLTVHDEVLAEGDAMGDVDEFVGLLTVVPDWADGLPIRAEGWSGDRYRK